VINALAIPGDKLAVEILEMVITAVLTGPALIARPNGRGQAIEYFGL
jgi:hypothetical protein